MDAISYSLAAKQAQRIKKFVAEPDSVAGLVSVPNLVPIGETVTIPSGRTVVHPNLKVDGTLTADGTLFIPSGGSVSTTEVDATVVKQNGNVVANDSTVVHNTGDETIAGVKTLTDGLKLQGQNVSPFNGFKNYIINGNFDIWQRGITFTAGGYNADRWFVNQVGGTVTVSATYVGDNSAWLGSRNVWQGTVGSGVTAWNLIQKIESVETLNNKKVTLSFVGAVNSGTMQLDSIRLVQNFGSGGSESVVTKAQTVTLTTTPQKYSISVTLPSVNGKTIGANSNVELIIQGTTVNVGQTMYIAQAQLEEGSVATPFENRPYGLELSLCQGYYEVGRCIQQLGTGTTIGVALTGQVFFKTSKRIVPTVTYSDSSGAQNKVTLLNNSGAETNGVSVIAGNQTNNDMRLTASTTNTTQNGVFFNYTASAEL